MPEPATGDCHMSADSVAVIGFIVLFVLMLLRVPVGMAMGLVGVTGFGCLVGSGPALKLIGQTSMRTVTDYTFGVIPMFLLMGAFVSASGISSELFRAANTFVGHRKGGLGVATIAACAGFAAISGSSVAMAATFSSVAYPEMRRYGYPQSFATGVIAAGGTLGAMLPPSTVLAVYGIITQQDIGKLFVAGIFPGLLAISMHMMTIGVIGAVRQASSPPGRGARGGSASRGCAMSGRRSSSSFSSSAGFTAEFSRRPRRAGWGRAAPFFSASREAGCRAPPSVPRCCRRRDGRCRVHGADRRAAFRLFSHRDAGAAEDHRIHDRPRARPYGVLALIMLMYLVLGCLMDAMAMIILTVPIIFPVVTSLGFDPIWFGVIIVMTVELGLIHPPVGMNVFVIKSVVKDVNFTTIFKGVIPFIVADPDPARDPDRAADHRDLSAEPDVDDGVAP